MIRFERIGIAAVIACLALSLVFTIISIVAFLIAMSCAPAGVFP